MSVTLVGIDGRAAKLSNATIRATILELYREHEAAGLCRPTTEQLYARCGSRSDRVHAIAKEMREAGELPDLPTRPSQRVWEASRRPGDQRQAESYRSPFAARRGERRARPSGVLPERQILRSASAGVYDLSVKAARRRERERAIWGPELIAAVSSQG